MADLFEQYAADFSELVASVRASVTSKHASADARRSILQNAESEVEEANDLLVQMEIEVRSYPQSVRERYTAKLQELKGEYEKLQKELVGGAAHLESAAAACLDECRDGRVL